MTCSTCGRATRPPRTTAAEFPGTVSSSKAGICSSCYYRERKASAADRSLHSPLPPAEPASAHKGDCVLVRVDVSMETFKTLRKAGFPTARALARYADHLAQQVLTNG